MGKRIWKGIGLDARDTGIDLVAQSYADEFHAIQCKFYSQDKKIQKENIDSFFTASGKKPFTHRIIITTTDNWSEHAENSLMGQNPPVTKINKSDLEASFINWSLYEPSKKTLLNAKKDLRKHQKKAVESVLAGFQKSR